MGGRLVASETNARCGIRLERAGTPDELGSLVDVHVIGACLGSKHRALICGNGAGMPSRESDSVALRRITMGARAPPRTPIGVDELEYMDIRDLRACIGTTGGED